MSFTGIYFDVCTV